jgi:hypothetical protein
LSIRYDGRTLTKALLALIESLYEYVDHAPVVQDVPCAA